MNRQRSLRLCLAFAAVSFWNSLGHLQAAPDAADVAQPLRRQALQFEKDRDWTKACDAWDVLGRNRDFLEAKNHYLSCLRHARQGDRHRDKSFREKLAKREVNVALKIYGEVLGKLQENYAEREKVHLQRLFQEGLNELHSALDEPAFRQVYLPGVKSRRIRDFQITLEPDWKNKSIQTTKDAEEQTLQVALAAQKALGLAPTVSVLEFACGACNALDEHSIFLTPSQLSEQTMNTPSVLAADILDPDLGTGYVQLAAFQKTTLQELDDAIIRLRMQGMRVLILDLRGNPGGIFEVAVQIAQRFIADGVIVSSQSQVPAHNRTYKGNNVNVLDVPLVVLVDGETASAAEVLAGALKENQRAVLVGQTTFGKGSVQAVMELGSVPAGLRITLAKLFSPRGQAYNGGGISPDIPVQRTSMNFDEPLREALHVAGRLTMMRR